MKSQKALVLGRLRATGMSPEQLAARFEAMSARAARHKRERVAKGSPLDGASPAALHARAAALSRRGERAGWKGGARS